MSTKTFRCCSHECFYGEADIPALIYMFQIGTGDGMPYQGKIVSFLGETFFYFAC